MEDVKAKIDELGLALRKLHRHFLENERQEAEERLGRKLGPVDFFHLLTQDESFKWLKPFSTLVTEIDVHPRDKIFSAQDLINAQENTRSILYSQETPIGQRYAHYLKQDKAFLALHTNLKVPGSISE